MADEPSKQDEQQEEPAEQASLEQQLDQLLSQINDAEPGVIDPKTGMAPNAGQQMIGDDGEVKAVPKQAPAAKAVEEQPADESTQTQAETTPESEAESDTESADDFDLEAAINMAVTAAKSQEEPAAAKELTAGEQANEEEEVVPAGDDLADEIQQLLDEDRKLADGEEPVGAFDSVDDVIAEGQQAEEAAEAVGSQIEEQATEPSQVESAEPVVEQKKQATEQSEGEEAARALANTAASAIEAALAAASIETDDSINSSKKQVEQENEESTAAAEETLEATQHAVEAAAADEQADEDELQGDFYTPEEVIDHAERGEELAPASAMEEAEETGPQSQEDVQPAEAETEHAEPPTTPASAPAAAIEQEDDFGGAFQTPEEVADNKPVEDAVAIEPAEMQSSAEVADGQDEPDPEPELPSVTQAAAMAGAISKDNDDLAGDFEAPEAVTHEVAIQDDESVAEEAVQEQALADESDEYDSEEEQPRRRARVVYDDDEEDERHARAPGPGRFGGFLDAAWAAIMSFWASFLEAFPSRFNAICAMINRPLHKLDKQKRDLFGYVGLISMFWAGVVVLVKASSWFFGD